MKNLYCSLHKRKLVQDSNCDFGLLFFCPKCEPDAYKEQQRIENEYKQEEKERKIVPKLQKRLIKDVEDSLKYSKVLLPEDLLNRLVLKHMNTFYIEKVNNKDKISIFEFWNWKNFKPIYAIKFKKNEDEKTN